MAQEQQSITESEGYYYSSSRAEIMQADRLDSLPEADDWEYLGSAEEMTPADVVALLQERYPDVSVELEFRHA